MLGKGKALLLRALPPATRVEVVEVLPVGRRRHIDDSHQVELAAVVRRRHRDRLLARRAVLREDLGHTPLLVLVAAAELVGRGRRRRVVRPGPRRRLLPLPAPRLGGHAVRALGVQVSTDLGRVFAVAVGGPVKAGLLALEGVVGGTADASRRPVRDGPVVGGRRRGRRKIGGGGRVVGDGAPCWLAIVEMGRDAGHEGVQVTTLIRGEATVSVGCGPEPEMDEYEAES